MESFATAYPVFFHDGEQELDKGQIGVHSVLTFKKFQAQLSRLVGVAAGQLSTVLVCRKTVKDTDKKQKLPISETTNFSIILNQHNPSREKNCHFLVSIKKSKKERKGSTRKRNAGADNGEDEDSNSSSRGDVSPLDERPKSDDMYSESTSPTSILQRPLSPVGSPPDDDQPGGDSNTRKVLAGTTEKVERILLRREVGAPNSRVVQSAPQRVEGFNPPHAAQVENRWSRPVILSAGDAPPPPPQRFNDVVNLRARGAPPGSLLGRPQAKSVQQQLIVECLVCKENRREFHCCINDRIVVGFNRSPAAGPIQRPSKLPA